MILTLQISIVILMIGIRYLFHTKCKTEFVAYNFFVFQRILTENLFFSLILVINKLHSKQQFKNLLPYINTCYSLRHVWLQRTLIRFRKCTFYTLRKEVMYVTCGEITYYLIYMRFLAIIDSSYFCFHMPRSRN